MTHDNPNIIQNKALIEFCKGCGNIFLYGCGETQYFIAKYLSFCGIQTTAYLTGDTAEQTLYMNNMKVLTVKEAAAYTGTAGVIMSISDDEYTGTCAMLREHGFTKVYFVSAYNKRTIPYKMRPRPKENFWLEVNLADHCNLNCQMCDHYSPVAEKKFLDYDQYVRDIRRLAELTDNHIGIMKLQGGEPLLNERCIDFVRVTREIFPKARIFFFTDGILLLRWEKHPSGNLWKTFKDCDVEVQLTVYPLKLNIDTVKAKAVEYNIRLACFSEVGDKNYYGVKHSVKHPFDLSRKQEPYQFISCYQFNESMTMKDGKIYTCPMIPYIDHFNRHFHQNIKITADDYIDIYKASSYEEIAEFCTRRVPFCDYCAVEKRSVHEWKQSNHSIDEWILTPEDMRPSESRNSFQRILMSLRTRGLGGTIQKIREKLEKKEEVIEHGRRLGKNSGQPLEG